MRRALRCLALLAVLAGCTDPTATRVRGDWTLTADASDGEGGYCVLTGDLDLRGSREKFTGNGTVHVTRASGFSVVEADVTGDAERVQVAGFELVIDAETYNSLVGTWTCDGGAGRWTLVEQ